MKVSKSLYLIPLLLGVSLPGAAIAKPVSVGLTFGQTTTLAKKGSLEVRAQCVQNEGGADVIRVFAVTTEANCYMDGSDDYQGDGDYLQPTTIPADAELIRNSSSTGVEEIENDTDDGWAFCPSGSFISVVGDTSLLAVNPAGSKFDCLVSVEIGTGIKFKAVK